MQFYHNQKEFKQNAIYNLNVNTVPFLGHGSALKRTNKNDKIILITEFSSMVTLTRTILYKYYVILKGRPVEKIYSTRISCSSSSF